MLSSGNWPAKLRLSFVRIEYHDNQSIIIEVRNRRWGGCGTNLHCIIKTDLYTNTEYQITLLETALRRQIYDKFKTKLVIIF